MSFPKLVQFMTRARLSVGSPAACSVCRALVANEDQQGHKQWHADNKETMN